MILFLSNSAVVTGCQGSLREDPKCSLFSVRLLSAFLFSLLSTANILFVDSSWMSTFSLPILTLWTFRRRRESTYLIPGCLQSYYRHTIVLLETMTCFITRCDFWVNASSSDGDEMVLRSKGRMGTIVSPRHTLPPNTTCTWHFRGTPGDLVWIYFINYFHETLIPLQDSQETGPTAEKKPKTPGTSSRRVMTNSGQNCTTRLRIWDGGGSLGQPLVLGEYCDSQLPKLCDHSSLGNLTRTTRPCSLRESYLSIGKYFSWTLQLLWNTNSKDENSNAHVFDVSAE